MEIERGYWAGQGGRGKGVPKAGEEKERGNGER